MTPNQVIIVAAGRGTRMGSETPKQFLLLGGRPLIMHSIEAFNRFDPAITIVLVLPAEYMDEWENLKKVYSFDIKHFTTSGGETRFNSVFKGLAQLPAAGIVGIHDGARPLIKEDTIERLYETARKKDNAVPYILPSDSVRIERKDTSVMIDRSSLRMIQTPQVFNTALIREAYRCKYSPSFTDDAAVFEKAGYKINLVEGQESNIKVTKPEDLALAEVLLSGRS